MHTGVLTATAAIAASYARRGPENISHTDENPHGTAETMRDKPQQLSLRIFTGQPTRPQPTVSMQPHAWQPTR